MAGFVRFHVHRDPDERDLLIALTERAQATHGRPVRSQEILDAATLHERALLPDSSRGICRALDRHVYQSDVFGRTIRRCRRHGHALWGVYIAEDAISWASEEKLRAHLAAIQAELARRAEERANPPAPPQCWAFPGGPNAV
jgi:hypothetical protein